MTTKWPLTTFGLLGYELRDAVRECQLTNHPSYPPSIWRRAWVLVMLFHISRSISLRRSLCFCIHSLFVTVVSRGPRIDLGCVNCWARGLVRVRAYPLSFRDGTQRRLATRGSDVIHFNAQRGRMSVFNVLGPLL